MSIPGADWKNQAHHVFDWLLVGVAGVLVVLYLLRTRATGSGAYVGAAAVLVLWLVVYFSAHWQPILYPVAAVALLAVTVVLVWSGAWTRQFVRAATGLNLVFVVLSVYLYTVEVQRVDPSRE